MFWVLRKALYYYKVTGLKMGISSVRSQSPKLTVKLRHYFSLLHTYAVSQCSLTLKTLPGFPNSSGRRETGVSQDWGSRNVHLDGRVVKSSHLLSSVLSQTPESRPSAAVMLLHVTSQRIPANSHPTLSGSLWLYQITHRLGSVLVRTWLLGQ